LSKKIFLKLKIKKIKILSIFAIEIRKKSSFFWLFIKYAMTP